jgi:predicted HAD superfamily phosphohydrolase YqeG
MKDDAMMKGKEPIEAEEVMTKELTGIYTDYDSSLVGETEDTVLFFHASWCPSCSAADKGIKS